jgi:hypothetical protein
MWSDDVWAQAYEAQCMRLFHSISRSASIEVFTYVCRRTYTVGIGGYFVRWGDAPQSAQVTMAFAELKQVRTGTVEN